MTLEKYLAELKSLVELIKESKSEQSEQAEYLLDDQEYYWLIQKSKKSGG